MGGVAAIELAFSHKGSPIVVYDTSYSHIALYTYLNSTINILVP
jgi:hypothetical protein